MKMGNDGEASKPTEGEAASGDVLINVDSDIDEDGTASSKQHKERPVIANVVGNI